MSRVLGNETGGTMALMLVAVLAACAGAELYGGGGMPQYGALDYEHDYHARSPDAPAPLDYKYQEEPHDSEKSVKFSEEKGRRRKERVEREPRRPALDDTEEDLELEEALESGIRSRRQRRTRGRRRGRGRGRRDEPPPRRPPLLSHRDRDAAHAHYLESISYRDEGDAPAQTHTTELVLERKPRQRMLVPPPPEYMPESTSSKISEDFDDEEKPQRPGKDMNYFGGEENDRLSPEGRMQGSMGRMRPALADVGQQRESGVESDDPRRNWVHKPAGNYPDYSDYQAMKNVVNIQNKMPTLLRRPTPSTSEPPVPKFSAGRVFPWSGRRAGKLALPADLQPRPTVPPAPTDVTTLPESEHVTTPSLVTNSIAPILSCTAAAPANASAYSPIAFFPNMNGTLPSMNGSELSIGDKSRLSILKKAQLKEAAGRTTKKPPVLLHVTSHVPTVVMVAPGSEDPWLRAREVAGDSPATLDKVKRLMRQKLVSGAKSIRDLTENWDELICDYIDVGMLDAMADTDATHALTPLTLLPPVCALATLLILY